MAVSLSPFSAGDFRWRSNAPTWLDEADLPRTTETLNNILGLIDQMQAVDTDGIAPLAHPLEATQRLRADVVTESDQRDAYQRVAPAVDSGLYLVPKVIE